MRFFSVLCFICILECVVVLSNGALRPNPRNKVRPAPRRIATTPRRVPFVGGKPAKSAQRPVPVWSPSYKYRDLPVAGQQAAVKMNKPYKPYKPTNRRSTYKPEKPTKGKYRLLPPVKLKGPRKASSSDDWIPRFQFWNITYPNPLDQTEYEPSVAADVMCVNMETDQAFILQDKATGVTVRVFGTRISYNEAGAYSGYTYSVLHIFNETYTTYQAACNEDTTGRCPNRVCSIQPGPWPIWYWRFELDPLTPGDRPQVMPGVSDVTVRLRTAQAFANHWPDCCLNRTVRRGKLSAAAKRKAMKRLQQLDNKDYRPHAVQGPRDDWILKLRIVSEWYTMGSEVLNTTGPNDYRLACVDAITGVKTNLRDFWARGRILNYQIRSGPLEGLIFRTREILQVHYWGAKGTCRVNFPTSEQFVQEDNSRDWRWGRLEIIETPQTTPRKVLKGYSTFLVPHALAQRFVNRGGAIPPRQEIRQRKKNKVKYWG